MPTPSTPTLTRYLRITGRVQGVYYRASVEALAQGPAPAVQALIDWAHRGPELARVDGVVVSHAEAEGSVAGFEQRETV
jgi:acylphosphatase